MREIARGSDRVPLQLRFHLPQGEFDPNHARPDVVAGEMVLQVAFAQPFADAAFWRDEMRVEMDVVVGQLDSLFLSLKTGVTLIPTQKPSLNKPARADSTDGEKLDESAFEIIPEKKK